MKTPLNIGMIGYGFMGRTHSNAYNRVSNFFDLEYKPVLKAACARNAENVQAFADTWGYESVETDWRKLIGHVASVHATRVPTTILCAQCLMSGRMSRKKVPGP